MARYYYLLASMPDPSQVKTIRRFQIREIQANIERNLSERDRYFFKYLLYPNDCQNLLKILFNKEKAPYFQGAYDITYLKNLKENRHDLPEFIQFFLEDPSIAAFVSDMSNLQLTEAKAAQLLFDSFYAEVGQLEQRFIQQYFSFDHRCK